MVTVLPVWRAPGERFRDFELIIPEPGNDAALSLLLDREVDAVYIYADQAILYK